MTEPKASPEEIVAAARKLLADDRLDEAQNLLLDEGYVKRLEPKVQQAYLQLIPVGTTLRNVLDEIYRDLEDPSPKVRFSAATKLARELSKERLRDNVRWMRDPRASAPITEAVLDPDQKVAERALVALSRLVCQYFPDQRALPAFLAKLSDRKPQTRGLAISGIGCLRREELLKHLVDMMDRGTDEDRSEVAGVILGLSFETFHHQNQHPIEWSEAGRQFWRDKMILALRDPHPQVRQQAARALHGLGNGKSLPALRAAHAGEKDPNTRYYMGETIESLEESK